MVEKNTQGEQRKDMQELRIKRSPLTDDGIVMAYLDAMNQPQTDLACEAIRAYWLPLALKDNGVKGKQLKSAGRRAIAQLMQQMELIRLECDLKPEEIPFGEWLRSPTLGTAIATPEHNPAQQSQPFKDRKTTEDVTTQQVKSGDNNDDDDWLNDEEDVIPPGILDSDLGFRYG